MKKGGGPESTIIIGPSKSVLVYALHSLEYVLGLARFRVFVPNLYNKRIDLENMKSICSLKDNFRSNITPKSFTLSKVSSRTELISYSKEIWVLDPVKETDWHFLILRVSKLLKHQLDIEVRSYCSSWQSDGSRIFLKSLRSSSHKRQFEYFKTKGKSLINILNKSKWDDFLAGHQT